MTTIDNIVLARLMKEDAARRARQLKEEVEKRERERRPARQLRLVRLATDVTMHRPCPRRIAVVLFGSALAILFAWVLG